MGQFWRCHLSDCCYFALQTKRQNITKRRRTCRYSWTNILKFLAIGRSEPRNHSLTAELFRNKRQTELFCKACPHWQQKLPKTAINCRQKRQLMLPNVAENGNRSRCFRQHLLPETATFCLRFRRQLWQVLLIAEYLAVT